MLKLSAESILIEDGMRLVIAPGLVFDSCLVNFWFVSAFVVRIRRNISDATGMCKEAWDFRVFYDKENSTD